jgi:hypothetical protein
MFGFLTKLLLVARSWLKSRARLEAENIILRQQVIVLSRKSQSRMRLRNIDRLIVVWQYRFFPSILNVIIVVKPETVIRWHRRGFRAYWRWKSRRRGGRRKIDREIRELIRQMSNENPLWGAPRIHGELLMLGIGVAQSTVARYMTRRQGHLPKVGRHSRATMPPGSRLSICLWFAPSPSSCSTPWSFFATPAGDW